MKVGEVFSDFKAPVIAVSDLKPMRESSYGANLPVILVMLAEETVVEKMRLGVSMQEPVLRASMEIGFLLPPNTHLASGAETPFFAHYDHEGIRDRLMEMAASWRPSNGAALSYAGVTVHAMHHAVLMCFRMTAEWRWCRPKVYLPPAIIFGRAVACPEKCVAPCPENEYNDCQKCPD